jgi:ABC-2 type transport system permease protein
MQGYSNLRAMRALITASLQSITKSPSAIVFSIAFPLIFILVFGFLGGSKSFSIKVATAPGTDTNNALYAALRQVPVLKWDNSNDTNLNNKLKEGSIAATLGVQVNRDSADPAYTVLLHTATSQRDKLPQLQGIINSVIQSMDPEIQKRASAIADVLPGQLGFSLLAGSVFGTAFVFFNMRQTLVLKRFFATPVRKETIVISEGISRMIFQLIGAVIIISVGHYAFDYTLVNGLLTFVQLIVLSALAILVFMGFGFIVSGLAKSESTIPPFANMITLPQFLLAGTFFSIDNFPKWLQPFCRALPLSFLNDAMRKVAFEGAGFWDVRIDILVLLGWGVLLYIIAGRVFRWE